MARMKESIEDFLARGGQIQRIANGVSGIDGKPRNRNIMISRKGGEHAEGYDPKAAGKAANARIFDNGE